MKQTQIADFAVINSILGDPYTDGVELEEVLPISIMGWSFKVQACSA